MAVNFNLLAREGPTNLYEGFVQGQQAAAQNALAQQKMAQERDLMSMRRQEFQANIESTQAERKRKAVAEKTAMFRDRVLRAPTPQAARELVRLQHSDPDLGPVIQQFGSLDQDLADIPDDPTGFENWRQREAMGAAEFIKSQASERGFQALVARARGGQQGAAAPAAAPEGELVAAPMPSPTGVMQEIAPGGAVGAQTPLSYLQSQFGTLGSAAPNALAPAAAPAANVLAAPTGGGRTPAQIRAEMDALSMSNDPRAVRMVQTLAKEYEAALRVDPSELRTMQALGYPLTQAGYAAFRAAQMKESAPPSMVAEYTFAKTPDGGNFRGSYQDFVTARAAAGRPPAQPVAPTITTVEDPTKPGNFLQVDARTYRGGGAGSPGVIGGARPSATAEKTAAQRVQLEKDLTTAISELKDAAKPGGLIDQSTGSGAGRLVDVGARFVGQAMPGDIAIGKLAPIADLVLKMVPRFEGPQSDKDTKSYKEAAGQLADATLPREIRKQAANTIVRLMENRKGQFVSKDMAAEGAGASSVPAPPPGFTPDKQ